MLKGLIAIEFLMNSKLIHLVFNNQYDLAKVFLRFQEYYESPNSKFRNHFFTLKQYKAWYKTTRPDGRFSYYSDWGGFNFPSTIMNAFNDGGIFYHDLDTQERTLVHFLSAFKGSYYVIGSFKDEVSGNSEAFDHEETHALYFFNKAYRKEVNEVINNHDREEIKCIKDWLYKTGYTQFNVNDEINAYHSLSLGKNKHDLNTKLYKIREKYKTKEN